MNIVISSTRQWNHGDEFIRDGVINLIEGLVGSEHNYLLWNRNPDLFVDGYQNDHLKTDFYTNSASKGDLVGIDMVVFAGTPEWLGGPVRDLMDFLYQDPEIPALFIGIGAGRTLDYLSAEDQAVLRRESTCIICRSENLDVEINSLLGIKKAIALACPALFVSRDMAQSQASKSAIIMQIDEDVNHSIATDLVDEFLALPQLHDKTVDIICFYISEYRYMMKHQINCRYSFEARDYLGWLKGYRYVISTRLHGAIAALSTGTPAVLVASEDNRRIRTTQKLFGDEILPISHRFGSAHELGNKTFAANNQKFDALESYKTQLQKSYHAVLEPWLARTKESTSY